LIGTYHDHEHFSIIGECWIHEKYRMQIRTSMPTRFWSLKSWCSCSSAVHQIENIYLYHDFAFQEWNWYWRCLIWWID
jgi:hypothetical protein